MAITKKQKLIVVMLAILIVFSGLLSLPSNTFSSDNNYVFGSDLALPVSVSELEGVTSPIKDCQEQNFRKLSYETKNLANVSIEKKVTFLNIFNPFNLRLFLNDLKSFDVVLTEAAKESHLLIINFIHSLFGQEG